MATIVIDPGHGGEVDLLGSSANQVVGVNGLLEKQLTLAIAQSTAKLIGKPHTVILTRSNDINLSLADRTSSAKIQKADIFISLHFNGSNDPSINGTETLVQSKAHGTSQGADAASIQLADTIRTSLVSQLGQLDRGLKFGRWSILNSRLHADNTARCIVEISFLSNPEEANRLIDEGYQQVIATGLTFGIHRFVQMIEEQSAVPRAAVGGASAWDPNLWRKGGYDPESYQHSASVLETLNEVWLEDNEGEGEEYDTQAFDFEDAASAQELTDTALGLSKEVRDFLKANENHAENAESEHFTLQEFQCKDSNHTPCPTAYRGNLQELMDNLEVLRSELSESPISINSGYRTPAHNKHVGGKPKSQHQVGKAADIVISGYSPAEVYNTIDRLQKSGRMNKGGLGWYPKHGFVHYDVRGVNARWGKKPPATDTAQSFAQQSVSHALAMVPDLQARTIPELIEEINSFYQRFQKWEAGITHSDYFPFSAICRLEMTYDNGNSASGTGFYVAPDRLLTAAHCLVDEDSKGNLTSMSSITVHPGQNGKNDKTFAPFTVNNKSEWKIHPKYAATTDKHDYDLGIVRVPKTPPSNRYFSEIETLRTSKPSPIIVCGYSAVEVSNQYRQHMDADFVRDIEPSGEVIAFNLQASSGASGSPVFYYWGYDDPQRMMTVQTIPVVGIFTGGYKGDIKYNYACLLTENKLAWVNQNINSW